MTTPTKNASVVALGLLLALLASAASAGDQSGNPFSFTDIRATEEGAVRLSWQSEPNTVYRIECASELSDPLSWQTLYDGLASHAGTSTFYLDTGNYFHTPPVLHPRKAAMRFYRIVNEGTNTGFPPIVAIASPAEGFVAFGDLTVTVIASTDQATVSTKLYVDGEQVPTTLDSTNWLDNSTIILRTTCATIMLSTPANGPTGRTLCSLWLHVLPTSRGRLWHHLSAQDAPCPLMRPAHSAT